MFRTWIGNPYDVVKERDAICVTTNGMVKRDGLAVMGRGSAEFARDTFGVDRLLGEYLNKYGSRVFNLGLHEYKGITIRLISFPTKHHWRNKSDLKLIRTSSEQLVALANKLQLQKLYVPIPGCGKGQLRWDDVKKQLNGLDERFVVYSLTAKEFQ